MPGGPSVAVAVIAVGSATRSETREPTPASTHANGRLRAFLELALDAHIVTTYIDHGQKATAASSDDDRRASL